MVRTFSHTKTAELMEGYRPSSVFHQLRYAILERMKRGEEVIPLIQGRAAAKEDVIRALLSGAHPYLVSEEGTGKTRLVRSIVDLLPPVPRIAGCPYNDDPAWGRQKLCPRCGSVSDPVKEFGIEWVTGAERFSRIQGNEYTNEAKLLGLKDIQAIASGMSPDDPRTFTGTGVFRANRGLLFVDELPAIRTKVQVLLHPILEEQKTVLEEYGWEYPLDLCVMATGNPEGFSHVNEVPRPLIDRLETIYLDLPEEDVELGIMMGRMSRGGNSASAREEPQPPFDMPPEDSVKRDTFAPWWLLTLINRSVRQSRVCRWLERSSSIRGTTHSLDHTYSSALMRGSQVASMGDAARGMRLALRGRMHLRQDLVEPEDPGETFRRVDELSDDLMRTALIFMAREMTPAWMVPEAARELTDIIPLPRNLWADRVAQKAPAVRDIIGQLERAGGETDGGRSFPDDAMIMKLAGRRAGVRREYLSACAEFIANILIVNGSLTAPAGADLHVPREVSWTKGRS